MAKINREEANLNLDVVTKRGVAKVLRKAANLIEDYGWTQGTTRGWTGSMCALGALRHAEHVLAPARMKYTFGGGYPSTALALAAQRALAKRIRPKCIPNAGVVYDWNDSDFRTKNDVTGLMRKTARELEHGGKL